jgi:hypothetical protein
VGAVRPNRARMDCAEGAVCNECPYRDSTYESAGRSRAARRGDAICKNGMQFRHNDCSPADGRAYPLPERTSLTANTPRALVSNGSGRPDRSFERWPSEGTSEPVKTNFLSSRTIPLSVSQVVAFAPVLIFTCAA